jgi:PAS domain S-box-containing protein
MGQNPNLSAEWLSTIFGLSAVGISIIDPSGRFIKVNPKYCDLLGYAKAELLTMKFMDVTHPEDVKKDSDLAARLFESEIDTFNIEKRYIRKDGSLLWVHLSCSCLRNENGEAIHGLGITQDITTRKQAEAALRESEERFRMFADQSPVSIAMADKDTDLIYLNKTWLDFTGRPMEEEVAFGWVNGVHPDDREQTVNTYLEAYQDKVGFNVEYRLKRHDGEYRWIYSKVVPRLTPNGEFAGYIGSVVDIQDRKKAEEKLRQSEERFRTLADNAPLLIFIADRSTHTFYRNKVLVEFLGLQSHPDPCHPSLSIAHCVHPEDLL